MTIPQYAHSTATTVGPPVAATLSLAGAIVLTGIVTGVLSLYAHTVMPGLGRTDDRTFVRAFQALDRAIYNPWFMSCFFGALVLIGLTAATHLHPGGRSMVPLLVASFVLYLGVVLITVTIHVPLNDAIKAAGDPQAISDVGQVRHDFHEGRWAAWNLVRTVMSICSLVLLVAVSTLQARGGEPAQAEATPAVTSGSSLHSPGWPDKAGGTTRSPQAAVQVHSHPDTASEDGKATV